MSISPTVGRSMTLRIILAVPNKKEIVEFMIKGYVTPDVAMRMNHGIKACDNYYTGYKKVVMLKEEFLVKKIPY
jgi:hypothetical protein